MCACAAYTTGDSPFPVTPGYSTLGLSDSQPFYPRGQWLPRRSTLVVDDPPLGEMTPKERSEP